MKFVCRIKKLRRKNHISQKEMAVRLGISASHYSHIEQGTKPISLDLFAKLTWVLNTSADYLIYGLQAVQTESDLSQSLSGVTWDQAKFIVEILEYILSEIHYLK